MSTPPAVVGQPRPPAADTRPPGWTGQRRQPATVSHLLGLRHHRPSTLAACAALAGAALIASVDINTADTGEWHTTQATSITPTPVSAATPQNPQPTPTATAPAVTYPRRGEGTFTTVSTRGHVLGRTGTLLRFQVSIENGITGLDPAHLTDIIDATYADPRGWTAGGDRRFQRVGAGENHDYTISFVTPDTRDVLCGDGPDGYTSCHKNNTIIINMDRWLHSADNYTAELDTYRRYAINHETGHHLGFKHELCPSPGSLAPVMQQQTLGLHGCGANAWPYVNGARYTGIPGHYDDPVPATTAP